MPVANVFVFLDKEKVALDTLCRHVYVLWKQVEGRIKYIHRWVNKMKTVPFLHFS